VLEQVFTHPINTNEPQRVRDHFYGLREAKPNLVGIAVMDRLNKNLGEDEFLKIKMWSKREIENYLCQRETLLAYAQTTHGADGVEAMNSSMLELENALRVVDKSSPWSPQAKVSDDFLSPLFKNYFARLGLFNDMEKDKLYLLAAFVAPDQLDPEITEKLDAILEVAQRAQPRE
jgi:hypothetical protein